MTAPTPVAAPSPSPALSLEQRVRALEEQAAAPQPKDFWDKLAAVSGLVGALATAAIAGIGIYATHVYNQRQQALEKVQQTRQQAIEQAQLIQNLMQPLFSGSGEQRDAASGAGAAGIPLPGEILTVAEGRKLDIALRAMALIDPEFVTKVMAMLERDDVLRQIEALASVGVLALEPQVLERARTAIRINRVARRVGVPPEQLMRILDKIVDQETTSGATNP